MSLLIGKPKYHSSWEHTVEDIHFWPGQRAPEWKLEKEDADYKYCSWDMDLDK